MNSQKRLFQHLIVQQSFLWILLLIVFFRIMYLYFLPLPLFGDEAQYWAWSQNLAWGYYSKPPLIAWIIKFVTMVLGDEPFVIRLPFLMAHVGTAAAIYSFLKENNFSKYASFGAIFYMVLPGVFISSQIASTDPLLLLFWSWAMVYGCRILFHEVPRSQALIMGTLIGFGLLAKYAMIWFILSFTAALFLFSYANERTLKLRIWGFSLLFALLIVSPNLLWNAKQGWVTFHHTAQNIGTWDLRKPFENLGIFFLSQVALVGPLTAWFLGKNTSLKYPKAPIQQFCWVMSIPLIVLISVEAFIGRAYGNWAAPASIGLVLWFVTIASEDTLYKSLWINLGLGLFIFLGPLIVKILPLQYSPYDRLYTGHKILEILKGQKLLQKDVVVASDNRSLTAQLTYLLRNESIPVVRWNPWQKPIDYFAMVTDLNQYKNRKVVLVCRWCLGKGQLYFRQQYKQVKAFLPQVRENYCIEEFQDFIGYSR